MVLVARPRAAPTPSTNASTSCGSRVSGEQQRQGEHCGEFSHRFAAYAAPTSPTCASASQRKRMSGEALWPAYRILRTVTFAYPADALASVIIRDFSECRVP